MDRSALGLIETRGFIGAIAAADTAAKAADVRLLGFERVGGGLVTLRLSGDVASVQMAVQSAAEAAGRVGELVSYHVIPHPHDELVGLLEVGASTAPRPRPHNPSPQDLQTVPDTELDTLSVARLRQLVRHTPGVELKGRQVSRANKQELLAALRRAPQRDA